MDGDTAYLVGRAFARVLAGLRGKETGDLRVGLGRDMRIEAPEMSSPRPRRPDRRGLLGPRRGHGRHRDALRPGRLARARRRRDGHRLAQPEGLHRRQAGPRGGAGALRRRRDRRCPRHDRGRAAGAARRRDGRGGRRLRRLSPPRPGVHRAGPGQAAARRRRRRQRDGGADGRPAARAPRPRPGDHLLGPRRRVPRPRAESRCCPRTGDSSSTRCSRRRRTWGSPGTATPTAASSSTTAASSSTATS